MAAQDVKQLGQLVEARPSEDSSDSCHTGIVLEFELGFPFFPGFGVRSEIFFQFYVGVLAHSAEFQAGEFFTMEADAAVGKDHGAFGIQFDEDG